MAKVAHFLTAADKDPKFRANVEKLLKDAALPQEGNSNTLGRNTQFELYLAAICIRAGLLPVNYDEPDVMCTVDGRKFCLAAKRLKNLDRFEDRVQEGIEQVRRAKVPGIVALDLTIARNPGNQPITSGLHSQLSLMIAQSRNRTLFEQYEQGIHRWGADSGVRSVLVVDFTFRVNPEGSSWIHDGMMCWFPTLNHQEETEGEFASFQTKFLRGVPNSKDLTAE